MTSPTTTRSALYISSVARLAVLAEGVNTANLAATSREARPLHAICEVLELAYRSRSGSLTELRADAGHPLSVAVRSAARIEFAAGAVARAVPPTAQLVPADLTYEAERAANYAMFAHTAARIARAAARTA